ncbi:AAA family ATPase [Pseudomonas kribbensis]|uniref:AAA family ATPase n=1 Tax=Pseudomonas kribbensis TaxID=1628086 RepID=UPI003BF826C0
MSDMLSFGVRNLRSFAGREQLLPVKAVSVFVGKNSCGKSTFLRTYPLLRQSVESDTRSPILWYGGHGGYVDFGDFLTALHDGAKEIFFDFEVDLDIFFNGEKSFFSTFLDSKLYSFDNGVFAHKSKKYKTKISIGLMRRDKEVLSTSVCFCVGDAKATLIYCGEEVLSFAVESLVSDLRYEYDAKIITSKGHLIPKSIAGLKEVMVKDVGKRLAPVDCLEQHSLFEMEEYVSGFFGKRPPKKIREKLRGIEFLQGAELFAAIKTIFYGEKNLLPKLESSESEFVDVFSLLLLARNVNRFWDAADDLFKAFYGGVRYLGPLRASAERFYRHQDLQIGEIDHTGANLPMVINSLEPKKKKELSDWILEQFGFRVELLTSGLHYAIQIKEEGEEKYHNISDMGFGYSQILPVIVSVWLELIDKTSASKARSLIRQRKSDARTLVIEQPELHLHPALQYKFGLAIAKVAALSRGRGYNFVIETHSKHLIDALGESVRLGGISEEEISIALFEKNKKGSTEILFSGFDQDGYLVNWPAGFLSA